MKQLFLPFASDREFVLGRLCRSAGAVCLSIGAGVAHRESTATRPPPPILTRMASCFANVLLHLASSPPGCMIREDCTANTTRGVSLLLPRFPIYVLNAPWLTRRRHFMRSQLQRLGATDVTWVTCANRPEVDEFTAAQRACAFPCQQLNRFHVPLKGDSTKGPEGSPEFLSNGTVSLALKHKLACFDMLMRNLTAALILEDDAVLPVDLWGAMARVYLPPSAQIFWMGSYSRRTNVGTLSDHEPLQLTASKAPLSSNVGPSSQHGGPIPIYKRMSSKFPTILGAVAYVMFASGARIVASEPVTTAADIAISYYPRAGTSIRARSTSTAVRTDASSVGVTTTTSSRPAYRSFTDGSCTSEYEGDQRAGHLYEQRTPTEQYGPKEWLIWPMPPDDRLKHLGDNGATHVHSQQHSSGHNSTVG